MTMLISAGWGTGSTCLSLTWPLQLQGFLNTALFLCLCGCLLLTTNKHPLKSYSILTACHPLDFLANARCVECKRARRRAEENSAMQTLSSLPLGWKQSLAGGLCATRVPLKPLKLCFPKGPASQGLSALGMHTTWTAPRETEFHHSINRGLQACSRENPG